MHSVAFWTVSLYAALVAAQNVPRCDPKTNGTTFNGTDGSELQLNSTTVRTFAARDANQGVAVGAEYLYAIDNYAISKLNKTIGEEVLQWYGGEDGLIIHLDGGVVRHQRHSLRATLQLPQSPIASSVEIWNASNLQHVSSHPFGISRGSLTWIDQDADGTWLGTFANYDRVQAAQMVPYVLAMNPPFVQFDVVWNVVRSWISPDALWQSFSPMSNSGEGGFGADGWLYTTGHDAAAVYVLKIPAAGSTLIWVATIALPDIGGQGIAWDRSQGRNGSLYGISREAYQIVEMRVPLQNCSWDTPTTVGQINLPGEFLGGLT